MQDSYLTSVRERFQFYKHLGEAALEQIPDQKLHWSYNDSSNSAWVIVKHMSGNMISRWTDFLTSDGEKPWRERDREFENDPQNRGAIMAYWEKGWQCLFTNLDTLTDRDLERTVYIRNQAHTVTEAINRQLGHQAYHTGQLVFLGKMICGDQWRSLSIPRGASEHYNREMFGE